MRKVCLHPPFPNLLSITSPIYSLHSFVLLSEPLMSQNEGWKGSMAPAERREEGKVGGKSRNVETQNTFS